MPISTVLNYVADTLDGVASPNFDDTIAYLAPPVVTEPAIGQPTVFVWQRKGPGETRQTMPRMKGGVYSTGGFKKQRHTVDIFAIVTVDPQQQASDRAWWQLLDALMATLRAVPIPVSLVDPDTGFPSVIEMIGEEFSVESDVVRSTASQRYVRYAGVISAAVVETFQS